MPFILVPFALLALVGCSNDTNMVRDAARAAGIGAEPPPPPDFVSRTRPGATAFMPVGVSAPKRRIKAKDAAEIAAADREMTSSRQRNETLGARAKAEGAASPPAIPANPSR